MKLINADELKRELEERQKWQDEKTDCAFKEGYDCGLEAVISDLEEIPEFDLSAIITGETSDGYHTFNELYHHRAILFSAICKIYPYMAWKSKKHHDGTMYEGMFIVGLNTPKGQATYHYDIDPYWEEFDVMELEQAPEWDGHTSNEAIERISQITKVQPMEWISVKDRLPEDDENIRFYNDGSMEFTTVLVYNETIKITNRINIHSKSNFLGIENTDGWVWACCGEVTHWMPLPEPPKE